MDNYAEVYVDIKARSLDRTFYYSIPKKYQDKIKVGLRVLVPFGSNYYQGYIVDTKEQINMTDVKSIDRLLDEEQLFTSKEIQLAHWMAEQYMCSFVGALEAMLPAGAKYERKNVIGLKADLDEASQLMNSFRLLNPDAAKLLSRLMEKRQVTVESLENILPKESLAKVIQELQDFGLIEQIIDYSLSGIGREAVVEIPENLKQQVINEIEKIRLKAPKQAIILETLLEEKKVTISKILKDTNTSRSSLNSLINKKLVVVNKEIFGTHNSNNRQPTENINALELTHEQQEVCSTIYSALSKEQFQPYLLHGVTGSGKTEVFIRAVDHTLQRDGQALVLVPEIALTPQMTDQFVSKFGDQVAVLHSGLTQRKKIEQWMRIQKGFANVVLGARSAVFAPLKNIRLIIIDEEHETSYKQDRTPKYHAKEVAEFRSKQHNAVFLVSSATPSLESYKKAREGNYKLLTMKSRVSQKSLPPVAVVDMREERRQGNKSIFSNALYQSLEKCINQGEQAILFLNRRGYSSFFICSKCGYSVRCPHCDISLTYHSSFNKLMCHYCGHKQSAINKCPRCGTNSLGGVGCGTQQVEQELKGRFSNPSITRVDVDTTKKQGSLERLLGDFRKGKSQVLVGTQMVAKGLDFPKVTLVGVVSADTGLNLPDFRAWERTFQLLTQVAGRAGRAELPGRVIVQTYDPNNAAIRKAKDHDYVGFYKQEILRRRNFGYPPFCHLLRIIIVGQDQKKVIGSSEAIANCLKKSINSIAGEVLGPAPAPVSKIKDMYRWHLIVKSPELIALKDIVRNALRVYTEQYTFAKTYINIDVNPIGII